MLSPQLLELLRAWWLQCRSQGWLFPSRDPVLAIRREGSLVGGLSLCCGRGEATGPRVR